MATIDKDVQRRHRADIARIGVAVTFQRVTGVAPQTTTLAANVTAIVRGTRADRISPERANYGGMKPGGISQDEREVIVMADALSAARFPMPPRKGDRILIADGGELFTVTRVDRFKRAMAGVIELFVSGVP